MLLLAHLDGHDLGPDPQGPWTAVRVLRPGLVLVAAETTRSAVYHALKDHLPPGTPLLVAVLDDAPKMKGMAPGSVAWARRHAPGG